MLLAPIPFKRTGLIRGEGHEDGGKGRYVSVQGDMYRINKILVQYVLQEETAEVSSSSHRSFGNDHDGCVNSKMNQVHAVRIGRPMAIAPKISRDPRRRLSLENGCRIYAMMHSNVQNVRAQMAARPHPSSVTRGLNTLRNPACRSTPREPLPLRLHRPPETRPTDTRHTTHTIDIVHRHRLAQPASR